MRARAGGLVGPIRIAGIAWLAVGQACSCEDRSDGSAGLTCPAASGDAAAILDQALSTDPPGSTRCVGEALAADLNVGDQWYLLNVDWSLFTVESFLVDPAVQSALEVALEVTSGEPGTATHALLPLDSAYYEEEELRAFLGVVSERGTFTCYGWSRTPGYWGAWCLAGLAQGLRSLVGPQSAARPTPVPPPAAPVDPALYQCGVSLVDPVAGTEDCLDPCPPCGIPKEIDYSTSPSSFVCDYTVSTCPDGGTDAGGTDAGGTDAGGPAQSSGEWTVSTADPVLQDFARSYETTYVFCGPGLDDYPTLEIFMIAPNPTDEWNVTVRLQIFVPPAEGTFSLGRLGVDQGWAEVLLHSCDGCSTSEGETGCNESLVGELTLTEYGAARAAGSFTFVGTGSTSCDFEPAWKTVSGSFDCCISDPVTCPGWY